jgi:uncharacterized protein
MDKKNLILVAISLAEDGYLSPAQIQKSMFLLGKKIPSVIEEDFYKFVPYNYGPFCREIYDDIDELENQGLVKFIRPLGQKWHDYSITKQGRDCIEGIGKSGDKKDINYFSKLISWVKSVSFKELLMAIYREYPEYKEKSIFQAD